MRRTGGSSEKIEWALEAEREFWADVCRRSFWDFFRVAWGAERYMAQHPQDRWLTQRLHYPICMWLQGHVEEWERRRAAGEKKRTKLALVIPRSFGKSLLATKALTLWAQLRNPDMSAMIGSEIVTKANGFLSPIKSVMDGADPYALFTWLYGNWYSADRPWTAGSVVHAARKSMGRTEPSLSTWGVEGGITGMHPDWGVYDDPISEEKIKESGTWIQAVNDSMGALRPAFRSDSFFMLSLTRYRDNDIVGTFLPREGVRSWSGMKAPSGSAIEVKETGEWDVYYLQARGSEGESIFSEMWPTHELDRYEESDSVKFAAQMMNEPGSGEHMALTQEQIDQLWLEEKELPSGLVITVHMDTAFKSHESRATGDESVIIVFGHDPRGNGDVYYLEGYGSNTWRVEDFTDKLVEIVLNQRKKGRRVRCMTDEREFGGKEGTWEQALRSAFAGSEARRMPPLVTFTRGGNRRGHKMRRMTDAASFWVDGHVKVVKSAPGAQKLIAQMVRLGISAHDDWADAAADVFAPEVYQPMLSLPEGKEAPYEGGYPMQPGDDILGRALTPEDVRALYDEQHGEKVGEWMERDEWQR